ncbi:MAG: imidazolonepropionase [Mariniblastus sp.]
MRRNQTLVPPETLFKGFRVATLTTDHPYGEVADAVIGVADGKIVWLGSSTESLQFETLGNIDIVDGKGNWITPGLIDCHTHLVYGGNRANEWEMRLEGKTYEEISREGGGILSSVTATRDASESQLLSTAQKRLECLLAEGVTTVEIKSGYGLDLETELKMLRVAKSLERNNSVSVHATLLGAHAVPPEFKPDPERYVDLVCREMIPAAKEICNSVDVFCESIAFSTEQTRRVFQSAIDSGLNIKIHAEQLTHMGAATMAAEMGAISVDHLEYLTDADCEVLSKHGTVATLLPGAFYCLQETQKPPIESLRQFNVPMAVATDANPGSSPIVSILTAANMACNLFGLTPEESFAGITRSAARALAIDDEVGTIEVGKLANFAIWNVESLAEVIYGIGHRPCVGSYFQGKKVF